MHRARATSAAPRYFKPFHHKATEAVFVDGATNYNNPVKIAETERRLLWPDHPLPDIVLSLGTGIGKEGANVTTEERMAGPMEYGAGLGKLITEISVFLLRPNRKILAVVLAPLYTFPSREISLEAANSRGALNRSVMEVVVEGRRRQTHAECAESYIHTSPSLRARSVAHRIRSHSARLIL
jgi:hypothetical protein